jgi:hypothetical protein
LFLTSQRAKRLQDELQLHAAQSDLIPVEDPNLVYVRPLNRNAPMAFAFKLGLPPGELFKLCAGEGIGNQLDLIFTEEIRGKTDGFKWQPQQDVVVCVTRYGDEWAIGGRFTRGLFGLGTRRLEWMEGLLVTSRASNHPLGKKLDFTKHRMTEKIFLTDFDENAAPDPFDKFNSRCQRAVPSPRRFAIWLEHVK